ncbi:MAG: hypothetical protein Q9168_001828 [Polycauliona sp. 1 TL-2023]
MRTFKLPSFFTLLGLLLGLASQVLITYSVHWGLGRHIQSLSLTQIEKTMTYIWHAQPLQLLANASGKLAIATLLVTLHGPKFAKAKTIFIWTLVATQTVVVIIAIAMIYAQCDPVEKLWKVSLPGVCNGRGRNEKWAYLQGDEVAELVIWNTAEMYLVLVAGSLPGLRPLCNKRVRALSNRQSSYEYPSRGSHTGQKREFALKLSNLPHSRTKAFASCNNIDNNNNHNRNADSTENFFANMGNGHIMKTTEVDIVHGEPSSRAETPSGQDDEQGLEQGKASRGSAGSDLEIGRIEI